MNVRPVVTHLVALLLPIAMLAGPAVWASPPAPPAAIRVRDYTRGDCSVDDTNGFRQAISAWQAASLSKTTGTLDLGSGCYRTSGTLSFGRSDGQFQFGQIRGDSSLLAVIRPDAGVSPAADMRRFKYSSISGFGITGSNPRGGVGLLLSNTPPNSGMGTNNLEFRDLNLQNFDTCLQIGEPNGAAAAALTFTQLTASNCNLGVYEAAFNTLDTTFVNLSLGSDLIGFRAQSAHQAFFHTGSGAGNTDTFVFDGPASFAIDGWREEPQQGSFVTYGGGTFAVNVSIYNSLIFGPNAAGAVPGTPAVKCRWGGCYLDIRQSHIGGDITADPRSGATSIVSSSIYSSAPWLPIPGCTSSACSGGYYNQKGNFRPFAPGNVAPTNPPTTFPDKEGRALNGYPVP